MPPYAAMQGSLVPDRMMMEIPGLDSFNARLLGLAAAELARKLCPKMSGDAAKGIEAIWGDGYFGVTWEATYLWYQEAGIRPFTMNRLAGKVIPMWIDDPTGIEVRKHPKARKRVTASGKAQILIFRKAAEHGKRKIVVRNGRRMDVPASYPGAPGRIWRREAKAPLTTPGRKPGAIAKGNIGVRWRHPGLTPRSFLRQSIERTARDASIPFGPILVQSLAKAV